MLTPNDIAEKKFDKVIMGGYDMGAVDDFLDQLEKDYGALFKENTVLKNKMKLLVKKIEEYRSMDESMRKALNSAQTMAAQIIDKAKAEAQIIKDSAQKSGEEILSGYEARIHAEEHKLAEAKASVEEFVTRMTTMYSQVRNAADGCWKICNRRRSENTGNETNCAGSASFRNRAL